MHILIVNQAPVPVFAYGGTERVIWDLAKALVAKGHTVSFLVPAGSSCPFARVIHIQPMVDIELQIPDDVDIVHFQFKPNNPNLIKKPWLMTQHGNSQKDESLPINTVFVSANHARRHQSQCYVLNGLDWSQYGEPGKIGAPYFHFLGKASWRVKNVKGAIDVALGANVTCHVLGGNRLNIKRGFRFTWSPKIRFHGMVGGEQKLFLLRQSSGLIFPVRWHEPFGLAIIESLYFGAPVFATPYGALPEIVGPEHGVLSDSKAALIDAIHSHEPNRTRNHDYVQDCFHAGRMADDYIHLYQEVLNGHELNPYAPKLTEPPNTLSWH